MIARIYKDIAKDKTTLSWIKKSTRDLLFPWNKQTSLTLEVTIVTLNVIVKGPCKTLSFRMGYLSLSAVQLEITWISIAFLGVVKTSIVAVVAAAAKSLFGGTCGEWSIPYSVEYVKG